MNRKEPVDGQQATVAWLSGRSLAHLCAASNIRATPEAEIPPAMRGDHYLNDLIVNARGRDHVAVVIGGDRTAAYVVVKALDLQLLNAL